MKIPILNGIYTDVSADFRTSYPLNLVPVPKQTGINEGYLRTAEGMLTFAELELPTDDHQDRGAITWNGICYRVTGKYLIRVDDGGVFSPGVRTILGEVGTDGQQVSIDYGFDYLSIGSAGGLFYYSPGAGLQQVTDPDLGTVIDHIWIAGYRMVTDGATMAVTELNNPFEVNPTKYGSSEAAPDPIKRLRRISNQAVALNRFTTEFFDNIGGSNFPFQRNQGAMIPKGCVGTFASCYFGETFAFVGGGVDEETSVFIGAPGAAEKIATREIEIILSEYTPAQQETIVLEARAGKMHQFIYMHLPDRTMVFDAAATKVLGEYVWFEVNSVDDLGIEQPYRARNFAYAYGKWLFGDTLRAQVGYLTDKTALQFLARTPWQFDTALLYNEGRGLIINELELVRLPGRPAIDLQQPTNQPPAAVWHSYTNDGLLWSTPRASGLTRPGMTKARTTWRKQGKVEHYRGLRFRGMNNPYPDAIVRLEARIELLAG